MGINHIQSDQDLMHNKRILIISQQYPPEKSGNASRIYDMSMHLSAIGNDITILCPFPSFPPGTFPRIWKVKENEQISNVNVIRLWTWQPGTLNPGFFERVLYYGIFPLHVLISILFLSNRYDIIITSSPPLFTHIPGFFAKIFQKKIWIMDIRDLWIDASISLGFLKKNSLSEKFSRKFEKACLHHADLIGVTTKELGRRLTQVPSVTEKIVHIPNGVDIRHFFPQKEIKKKRQFVYTGNIGHAQDLELVISAVKSIQETHPVQFLLSGGGDIEQHLKEVVNDYHLDHEVIFLGPQHRENIPIILNEALFGVAPLKNLETLEYAAPTKVYEYMACGIPFLATGKGEIVNIAKASGAGIIADNSTADIAIKIKFLLDNPIIAIDMGQKGREYIEKRYDRKQIAIDLNEHMERIYAREKGSTPE